MFFSVETSDHCQLTADLSFQTKKKRKMLLQSNKKDLTDKFTSLDHCSSIHAHEFLRSMKKSNKKLAKAFNLASRCIDDLTSINYPRFKQFLKDIYPDELVV